MLRSIVFLLVIISVITTPTRAYEANANLIVQKQQIINKEQEITTNIQTKKKWGLASKEIEPNFSHQTDASEMIYAFNNQTKQPLPILEQGQKAVDMDSADVCLRAVLRAEKDYQIKSGLLQTIASVESGRWDKKAERRVSWPWAVQVNGKGYYYQSKEEAVKAVQELLDKGINNIDIGCMQINMKYHGEAFENLEEAFEPEKNVRYSARFLRSLYRYNGNNWERTAMQYHSKKIGHGLVYKAKLEQHYAVYIAANSEDTLF